jgi:hypothetical protein
MGIDGQHPAIGHDLTTAEYFHGAGRAQMQFHDIQAWLVTGKVVILQPNLPIQSFLYEPGGKFTPDPAPDQALMQQALAHALWPAMMIKKNAYRP